MSYKTSSQSSVINNNQPSAKGLKKLVPCGFDGKYTIKTNHLQKA